MIQLNMPLLGKEEKEKVMSVLDSGQLAAGRCVKQFEEEFAEFTGTKFAVATSSGTTALHVALLSLGISQGDIVITTPFTFAATASAILHCGAIPVFADIDPKTLNIDPDSVKQILKKMRAKALLVVHLFGIPCDMAKLSALANEYGLYLVEDCAQAHGASYQGKSIGTFGHVSAFSFYATKNMTTGEGGMILTDQQEVYDKAKLFSSKKKKKKYHYELVGYNFRMTEIAAAIGLVQLRKLPAFISARQRNATLLTEALIQLETVNSPYEPSGSVCVYHQYTVTARNRDSLQMHMADHGVQCGIYYPKPLHTQPVFRPFYQNTLPEAEKAAHQVLSLPVHPGLSQWEINYICRTLERFIDK
jgi:dTDP-4-amino-4,6-dideoxygalactose transaminase